MDDLSMNQKLLIWLGKHRDCLSTNALHSLQELIDEESGVLWLHLRHWHGQIVSTDELLTDDEYRMFSRASLRWVRDILPNLNWHVNRSDWMTDIGNFLDKEIEKNSKRR